MNSFLARRLRRRTSATRRAQRKAPPYGTYILPVANGGTGRPGLSFPIARSFRAEFTRGQRVLLSPDRPMM